MTLIQELIDIPERVAKGDFVLRLTEGVDRAEETLRDYVVTPELARCFDSALTFIRSSIQRNTSKATYLHGSFGSGKSHFMAVLHLILQGNPAARSIPELAPVIQKHNDWLAGKRFLLVPYHMINAHDMESGVLGQYVAFLRKAHPEAPIPPVYMSASILRQAVAERDNYGDEPFFRRLNGGAAGAPGSAGSTDWGDLSAPWDATSFDAALAAPPDSEVHKRLVSTVLQTIATSHAEISNRGGNFVRFDTGLSIISQHAASLGYDGLILFLDELILWLAMNSADLGFVKREAAKLTNLVEAQSAERPIPLISFVARQRDLRELVGDHVPGAERLSFSDSLDWQQGRLDTITLEDRNLPAIAEKRVLKCRTPQARAELDTAFEQTARIRDSVMSILLTQKGDREMFRRVYPFSPALVQTLIAVSSVLQRERTALKVMMQLLVDHRETLRVGDIVPVGDLFDVVAHGDEAFSQEMAVHFDNAKRLYHQKLLPVLEAEHGQRREELEALPYHDARRTAFRNDDRLVKTLLLSALVPEVESLRGLTAEKLAALNHGTMKTPVAGKEGAEVLRRVKKWVAAGVGEIQIGDQSNPTISVQLSGVDTETIIAQARREDNQGNRVRRVRQMLYEQFCITAEGTSTQYREFVWRNTRRNCVVLMQNIRELPDSSFENSGDDWKLVIDYPFDEPGHGPRDDLSTLQRFRQTHAEGTKTLCWVPSFFSVDAQKDLGLLVILEHVLTGERFGQFASHLSPQDRQSAKTVLENQRGVLRQRVQNHLDAAYGLDVPGGSLDTTHDLEAAEHYVSLENGLTLAPPVAANLAGALEHLLTQALEHEFPAAPHFGTEIRPAVVRKVYELIAPATEVADGRLPIDKTQRALVRDVANPLRVGEMGPDATVFLLEKHWPSHFLRKQAETGSPLTVKNLRLWINDPRPMGLSRELQNFIILLFAKQTNRTFVLHNGPYNDPTLQSIPDECHLRSVDLPAEEEWTIAQARAQTVFGIPVSRLLSAANVDTLSRELKSRAATHRTACQQYVRKLRDCLTQLGLEGDQTDRLRTASAALKLLDQLHTAEPARVVQVLAQAEIATSETAMATSIAKGAELEGSLETAGWSNFELLRNVPAAHRATADEILGEVRLALAGDEYSQPLATALRGAQFKATRLVQTMLQERQPPADRSPAPPAPSPVVDRTLPPVPVPPVVVPPVAVPAPSRSTSSVTGLVTGPGSAGGSGTTPSPSARQVVSQEKRENLSLEEAQAELARLQQQRRPGQAVRVSLGWVIDEETR